MSSLTSIETGHQVHAQPLTLVLQKQDSLSLQFAAFGCSFKSLLEENQRLNEALAKEAAQIKADFLLREMQALELKEKVQVVTNVDFSEAETLENEIEEAKERVLATAKTIEATLRSRIFELEAEIEKKKAEFKKERAGLDELEAQVAKWQGKVNAYIQIKVENANKIQSLQRTREFCIEECARVSSKVIQEAISHKEVLETYQNPPIYKKTKQDHGLDFCRHLHQAVKLFCLRQPVRYKEHMQKSIVGPAQQHFERMRKK